MIYIICQALFSPFHSTFIPRSLRAGRTAADLLHGEDVPSAALPSPGGHPAPQGRSGPAGRLPASSMGKMYHRLLFPPLVATQLSRAAPGRPGGCRPPPWGRCTIGCSSLPWWPPSSPGLLRAALAAASHLQGEEGTVGCSLLSWWPPASQGSSAFPPWPLWAASCKQMASALLVAS